MSGRRRDFAYLGRLAGLLLPYWPRVLGGVALALAAALANIGLLALSSWFIASMALAGAAGAVIDYTLPAAGVRALAIVRAVGRYAERLANHDTTFRILGSIRLWFFRKIEPLAPARLAEYRSGDLLSRIRSDIDTLDDFYVRGLVPAVAAILALACVLPFLAHFDRVVAMIDGLALVVAGLALPIVLGAMAAASGREVVDGAAKLRSSIVEEVDGMAELLVLGAAEDHARVTDEAAAQIESARRRLDSIRALGDAATATVVSLAVALAALELVPRVASGAVPPADLAMLTVFVLSSFETIVPLPAAFQKAGEMAQAARRLFEIIDAKPAVAAGIETAGQGTVLDTRGAVPESASAFQGSVNLSIRNLRFRYTSNLPFVIDSFSLEAPAGSHIAIMGPSGSGKSSLVNILLRFWDYEAGQIELCDRDLRSFEPEYARTFFSVIPQSPFLFYASIRENLLVAIPGTGVGTEPEDELEYRLLDAIEAAQLSDFVFRLSEGLDTLVGETGKAVSVGEAQRISVARAFLKDAPILLLDEPTEGLDARTADALLESIAERAAGKTLILISHRDRDLAIVDRVYRLDRP